MMGFSGLGNGRGIILGDDGEIQQLPIQEEDDHDNDFGVVQKDNIYKSYENDPLFDSVLNSKNKDDKDEYDDDFDKE